MDHMLVFFLNLIDQRDEPDGIPESDSVSSINCFSNFSYKVMNLHTISSDEPNSIFVL